MTRTFTNFYIEDKLILGSKARQPILTNRAPVIDIGTSPTFVQEYPTIELLLLKGTILDAMFLSKVAMVCRFNGLWPHLEYIHS